MDSPLISVADLAGRLTAGSPPVLLDVRWDVAGGPRFDAYREGHIPGAVFVNLDIELAAAPRRRGRHPLPEAGDFERHMRRAGVSAGKLVVVYDAGPATAAARAWWLLRYFGHDPVAVLDGGWAAWQAAGEALERAVPDPPEGDFIATPGGMPVLNADTAAALARRGLLLDARSEERFRGQAEPVDAVAGHIPGARNRPATLNVDSSGRFLDPGELQAAFAALGVGSEVEVGSYCGSGVTAAHQVLALAMAGHRAALYPGSWSEWITDPRRPVATGDSD